MKTTFLFPFLSLLLLLTTSCDPDAVNDLLSSVDEPTVSYSETTLEATFFQEGNSPTPSISWNGDQGSATLSGEPNGVTINSTTGRISWDKTLPPGDHDFDVVVANDEGQVVVPMTIENPISGTFDGTYGGSYDFMIEIAAAGTITVFADGETASGTYAIEDGRFTAYYVYDNYPDLDYSILADVNQTGTEATVAGEYYGGVYSPGDQPVNVFEVTLQ